MVLVKVQTSYCDGCQKNHESEDFTVCDRCQGSACRFVGKLYHSEHDSAYNRYCMKCYQYNMYRVCKDCKITHNSGQFFKCLGCKKEICTSTMKIRTSDWHQGGWTMNIYCKDCYNGEGSTENLH